MKVKFFIVANCFEFEIRRSLRKIIDNSILLEFDWLCSYAASPKPSLLQKKICNADVVITQNPKKACWSTHENLTSLSPFGKTFIKTEFWRFSGFWPSLGTKANPFFWYPLESTYIMSSFAEYMNSPIDSNRITTHFNEQLHKLAFIDSLSDVYMFDFVIKNIYQLKLFSDDWHPMPVFFDELAKRIGRLLDIPLNEETLPSSLPMGINNDRHCLVQGSVLDILGINRSIYMSDIYYFGKRISCEQYFYFTQYISDKISIIKNQAIIRELFYDFIEKQS